MSAPRTTAPSNPAAYAYAYADGGGGSISAAAIVRDPDIASVVLLLDFDGVDGATDITDLSPSAHVDTFVGSAEVDTAQQFLGETSLLTDGVGDEGVTFPSSADWDMGTGDFTYECGVRFLNLSVPASQAFLSNSDSTNGAWLRYADGTTKLQFLVDVAVVKEEDWTPATNTWYHVAATRSGTSIRLFVDGVELGTATSSAVDIQQGTEGFRVAGKRVSTEPVNGYIGAVRVTKGVARYTANFTPLTVFYPTS